MCLEKIAPQLSVALLTTLLQRYGVPKLEMLPCAGIFKSAVDLVLSVCMQTGFGPSPEKKTFVFVL